MNIELVGRHLTVDPKLRATAEDRLEKLSKLLGEPIDVHVTLENEKHRQIAEVRIKQRRGELLAREEAPDLLAALNLALEKISAQARRVRERTVDRRKRPAHAAAPSKLVSDGGVES